MRLVGRLSLPLFILATLANSADFTTYIGDANQYQVAALTTDSSGNTYVTGGRTIQVPGINNPLSDVFVTKLDAAGNIVFTTTFGGKGSDQGAAIALDPTGNIWVGGSTSSTNFPLYGPLQAAPGAATTGFLAKLAPDGTIIYASYFGGTMGTSTVSGIATDPGGNVYLTGTTNSYDFPSTPGLPSATLNSSITSVSGAFVTKLDPTGSHIIYSAVIAGNTLDCSEGSSCFLRDRNTSGVGIALDSAGNAYIAGNTNTIDLPVSAGGLTGYGAFAAEINGAGSGLAYLTYLGPPAEEQATYGPGEYNWATAIAVDSSGNAYLTGFTNDPLLPTTVGAYQTQLNAGTNQDNAFAENLSPAGAVVWSTYLGGPGSDVANSVSLDTAGNVWLAGNNAAGFPTPSPGIVAAPGDFLAELSAGGSRLLYTQEFAPGTAGQAVVIEAPGVAHVAGLTGLVSTITPGQPSTPRVFGIVNAAAGQVSGRIAPGEIISIYGFGLGPTTPATATPVKSTFPTSLGGVQVLLNGSAIPLLYVSASQINAEIPAPLYETSGAIRVLNSTATLPDFHVSLDASIPGIFENPDGTARAINQDGTVNSAANPAKAGTIVSIWATGFDGNDGPSVNGQVPAAANNWCYFCTVSVNGVNAAVQYAGAAPGLIDGAMQINFTVPLQLSFIPNPATLDFGGGLAASLYVTQ